jgi:hypothetical protein
VRRRGSTQHPEEGARPTLPSQNGSRVRAISTSRTSEFTSDDDLDMKFLPPLLGSRPSGFPARTREASGHAIEVTCWSGIRTKYHRYQHLFCTCLCGASTLPSTCGTVRVDRFQQRSVRGLRSDAGWMSSHCVAPSSLTRTDCTSLHSHYHPVTCVILHCVAEYIFRPPTRVCTCSSTYKGLYLRKLAQSARRRHATARQLPCGIRKSDQAQKSD